MKISQIERDAHIDRLVTQFRNLCRQVVALKEHSCETNEEREEFDRDLNGKLSDEGLPIL